MSSAISEDLNLKTGYWLRLISFAPFILWSLPGLAVVAVEAGLSGLSYQNVHYSLSWHHYPVPLTFVILFGFYEMKKRAGGYSEWFFFYAFITALWQFATLFSLQVF